jgi:hypothetical protein
MNKIACVLLTFITLNLWAAETKTTSTYPELSDIRCETTSGINLADFKAKLVENCDLNKPFSSSMTKLLNDMSFFYCCQIKK